MATVFMKWLEKNPKDYDRGIRLITLGRIRRVKKKIAAEYVSQGMNVLEIGCGTGTLALQMAEKGATVSGIDSSPAMLAEAAEKVERAALQERISLQQMDATVIAEHFPQACFDLIVSTLVFSELPPEEQRVVLAACRTLLKPQGRLLIADEVLPEKNLKRLLFLTLRLPLALITWLLTRTSTAALNGFPALLQSAGFQTQVDGSWLGGSLVIYRATPAEIEPEESIIPADNCRPAAAQSHPAYPAAGPLAAVLPGHSSVPKNANGSIRGWSSRPEFAGTGNRQF